MLQILYNKLQHRLTENSRIRNMSGVLFTHLSIRLLTCLNNVVRKRQQLLWFFFITCEERSSSDQIFHFATVPIFFIILNSCSFQA